MRFKLFDRVKLNYDKLVPPLTCSGGRVFYSLKGKSVVVLYDRTIVICNDDSLINDDRAICYDLKVGERVYMHNEVYELTDMYDETCWLRDYEGKKYRVNRCNVIPEIDVSDAVLEIRLEFEEEECDKVKCCTLDDVYQTSNDSYNRICVVNEDIYDKSKQKLIDLVENEIKEVAFNTKDLLPSDIKCEDDIISSCFKSKKNDIQDDKLRWDLLPLEEIEDIVRVYHAGAKKYGPNNWQGLENGYQRYKAALLRHLLEADKGNAVDSDTGCLHLAQVAWNAIAMLYLSKRKEDEGKR